MFKTFIGAAALALTFGVSAGQAQDVVDGPRVDWRLATFGSPRTGTTNIETLSDYVSEHTGGKFTITLGYGTFGEPREFLDLLKIGAVQAAMVQPSLNPDRLPLYTVLDLPFLPLSNPDVQRKVHDAVHQNPEIQKEFAAWNAVPFMSSLLPSYEMLGTTEPPEGLEDFKGLRVRALGGAGDALAKLGAVPTAMPASEVYVSLDRGLLNAVAFPYYAHVSFRSYELGKWMTTNLALGTTAFPVTLNKTAYEDLPDQYKQVLKDAREAAYKAQKKAVTEDNQESLKTIKDAGVKLIELPEESLEKFRKIGGKPVWDAWVESKEAAGLPGQEIFDLVQSEIEKARDE